MKNEKERQIRRIRRWFLFGLWIASLLSISYFGNVVSYGFFWTVTAIGPVCFVYLAAVILRFKLYQELESRDCISGQPVPYFFILQNEDYFAHTSIRVRMFSGFSDVEELPEGIEYALGPGDKFVWHTNLICKYRGEYEVGVREIIVTDFLRLFSLRYKNPSTIKALVSPRYVRLFSLHSLSSFADRPNREVSFRDTSPAPDVRDYQAGDDVRLLHWSASARAQKLLVRNRIGEEKRGLSLYLDARRYSLLDREYLPLENKMLEVFYALGGYFAERDTGFCAFCIQQEMTGMQVASRHDFEPFSRFVDRIAFTEGEKQPAAALQLPGNPAFLDSNVFLFVLHDLESGLIPLIEQLADNGSVVIIYLVRDNSQNTAYLSESLRCRIVTVPTDAALEEIL